MARMHRYVFGRAGLGVTIVMGVTSVTEMGRATISPDSSVSAAYAYCMTQIAGSPAYSTFNAMIGSTKDVTITKDSGSYTSASSESDGKAHGVGTGSTIHWNIAPTSRWTESHLPPGATCAEDKCATLVHEMEHAFVYAQGWDQGHTKCSADFPIATREADATRAENAYRVSKGLCYRDNYEGNQVPSSGYTCAEAPPAPKGGCGSGCSVSPSGVGVAVCDGDPHQRTFDGLRYDFHGVGEFVLARSTTDSLQVQTRHSLPYPDGDYWTVVNAVAMNVAGDVVSVYQRELSGSIIVVNGAPASLAAGGMSLPNGGMLTVLSNGSVDVHWPDGSELVAVPIGVWGLNVSLSVIPSRAGHLTGLAGNFDANPANDLVTSTGVILPVPPSASDLYPTFANSWRITSGTSLFTYAAGESTATYTDLGAPYTTSPPPLSPAQTAYANAVCSSAGVADYTLLAECVYDVGSTGQPAFADGFAALQDITPTQVSIASGGTASFAFSGTAGQNLFIDVPSTSLPDGTALAVLDSTGSRVVLTGAGDQISTGHGYWETRPLPSTGSYTFRIGPVTSAGTATVRFYDPVIATQPISVGAIGVRAFVASPGSSARLTFSGAAGESIYVDASGATVPDECDFILLGPTGAPVGSSGHGCIVSGTGSYNYGNSVSLPSAGTYSVLFRPTGARVGQATFTVHH